MELSKLASSIINDITAGLSGTNANPNISYDQIEDEIIEQREAIIKEMYLKRMINIRDLTFSINCINVDCADPANCCTNSSGKSNLHFEIPVLMNDLGNDAITWLGTIDKEQKYDVYFNRDSLKYRDYKRRGANKPYVFIDTTLNKNGLYDGWIFNAPYVKTLSITAVFKDPRQIEQFNCCDASDYLEMGTVSTEIKRRLTEQKIRYYRGQLAQVLPNTQVPR